MSAADIGTPGGPQPTGKAAATIGVVSELDFSKVEKMVALTLEQVDAMSDIELQRLLDETVNDQDDRVAPT